MPFDKLSLKDLKEIAKQHKNLIKGYTSMGKEELVKTLKKHLKMDRTGAVTVKVAGGKLKSNKEVKHEFHHPKEFVGGAIDTAIDSLHSLKEKLLEKVDKLTGGQLPSSVTDKLEDLKIEGGKIEGGKIKLKHVVHRVGNVLSGSTGNKYGDIGVAAGDTALSTGGENTQEQSQHLADTYACNTAKDAKTKKLCNKKQAKDAGSMFGGAVGDDKIDWEDMKWGSFTEQLQQWNRTHPKKQMKDLRELAEYVRADPSKFKPKTKKRADFYINVIAKKKSK